MDEGGVGGQRALHGAHLALLAKVHENLSIVLPATHLIPRRAHALHALRGLHNVLGNVRAAEVLIAPAPKGIHHGHRAR